MRFDAHADVAELVGVFADIHRQLDQADVRMMVSAGPYALRPSEEVSIVVAVALAKPVPGTFTSNVQVGPGDPLVETRPIMLIAADLRAKLRAAEGLLGRLVN